MSPPEPNQPGSQQSSVAEDYTSGDTTTDVRGPEIMSVVAKTGDYTVIATDCVILVDASGGAVTITLPLASDVPNRAFYIKKTDSTGFTVTVDPVDADTIDGDLTKIICFQNSTLKVFSDGTEYHIG